MNLYNTEIYDRYIKGIPKIDGYETNGYVIINNNATNFYIIIMI